MKLALSSVSPGPRHGVYILGLRKTSEIYLESENKYYVLKSEVRFTIQFKNVQNTAAVSLAKD